MPGGLAGPGWRYLNADNAQLGRFAIVLVRTRMLSEILFRETLLMKLFALFAAVVLIATPASASLVFEVGTEGFDADTNNWPGAEGPEHAIDGVGQKYLNFGKENTGVLVTPQGALVPTSITLWAANDAIPRDPASFAIYGTNDPITASAPGDLQGGFTLIAEDAIALPDTRNGGGASPLLPENSATVSFSNSDAFNSYMIVFPSLKDSAAANSMQVAEIQLMDAAGAPLFSPSNAFLGGELVSHDAVVPEPCTFAVWSLLGLCITGAYPRQKRAA